MKNAIILIGKKLLVALMSDVIYLRGFDKQQKAQLKEAAKKATGKASVNAFIHYLVNEYFTNQNNQEPDKAVQQINKNSKELPYPISFSSKKRLQATFYLNDVLNIEYLANLNECSPTNYISSLIRNHLYNSIELTGIEIDALRKSNFQLSGMGNNLNQIAKRVNLDMGIDYIDMELIKELIAKLDKHILLVNNCLQFNLNRW